MEAAWSHKWGFSRRADAETQTPFSLQQAAVSKNNLSVCKKPAERLHDSSADEGFGREDAGGSLGAAGNKRAKRRPKYRIGRVGAEEGGSR